jgi:hypothetical protein
MGVIISAAYPADNAIHPPMPLPKRILIGYNEATEVVVYY